VHQVGFIYKKIRFNSLINLFEFMTFTDFLDTTPCWVVIYTQEHVVPTLTIIAEKIFLFRLH